MRNLIINVAGYYCVELEDEEYEELLENGDLEEFARREFANAPIHEIQMEFDWFEVEQSDNSDYSKYVRQQRLNFKCSDNLNLCNELSENLELQNF